MKAIKEQKYTTPTEIQQKVIPVILKDGQDVMASAETGAGKTVAYLLPTLNRLLQTQSTVVQDPRTGQGRGPRVMILTPTRELADQVTETIRN
jgi:superfamily II DNA/RNA helicase